MPDPDVVIEVIMSWIAKAENDLTNAAHTLKLGKDAPTDTVCFHAQQCIEKYLKSIMVLRSIDVPKSHNLAVLMKLIPRADRPDLEPAIQKQITEYAVAIRYPDLPLQISLAEAKKAVAIARRIRRDVRRLLPRAALRRKKK